MTVAGIRSGHRRASGWLKHVILCQFRDGRTPGLTGL